MVGIAKTLGWDGVDSWLSPRRNMLLGLGADLMSGNPGGGRAMLGRQADDAYATQQKAEAERVAQINQTTEWLRQNYPQFAGLPPAEGFKAAMEIMGQKPVTPDPFTLGPGQTRFAADGTELASIPAEAPKPPAAPSGYRYKPDGLSLEAIPGGNEDPAVKAASKPPTEAQQRAASLVHVVTPELKVVEESWDQLDNWENQAMGGKVPGTDWAPLQGFTSSGNQQAQNALKTIISSYLYAISGATANPGEVANNIDILTPKMGDKPEVVAAKKARVRAMVEAIAMQAKGGTAQPVPGVGGGGAPGGARTTSTGVTYTVGQ